MRRILYLLPLALLLAVQTLFAQSKVTIKGKIQKPLSGEVVVASYPTPLQTEEIQTVVKLNNGQFQLDLPAAQAGIVELAHGNEEIPIYLEPGFNLELALNGQKFGKSIKFTGKGANENNFLSKYTRRFDDEEDYQPLPDNIKLREREFVKFLNDRKEDQLAFLEKFTDKKPVSDNFMKLMLAEIDYGYANDKLTYFELRERVIINDRSPVPSVSYFDFLQDLDTEHPASLMSIKFSAFLRNYVAYLAKESDIISTDKHYFKKTYDLVTQRMAGEARTMAQAYLIRQSLQLGNVLHAPALLQHFGSTAGKPAVHAALDRMAKGQTGLGVGSIAPDFQLKDINGDTVSLSDFRGKVVYLGFWRINCGLCMIERPHAQELARKLKAHDVVVVHIGVDDDEQVWRRTVESRGKFGVQLHLKGQGAELVKQYGLKDVPAYFLIDETGSIISTKPRRPNDREVEKEILQHVVSGRASAR